MIPSSAQARKLAVRVTIASLTLLLAACETPINNARAKRFGDGDAPAPVKVEPRALALALQATTDGRALTPASLRDANALLTRQGRIGKQVLTLTPLNERGQQLAPRLAQALHKSGAQMPHIEPLPTDAQRLAHAASAGWDLELQSEALAVDTARCGIANPRKWAIHPYYGIGALGCANRANIARMASDPRDLVRPQPLDAANGVTAATAVDRYQRGDTHELLDIDFEE